MVSDALKKQAEAARNASITLANLSTTQKNEVLKAIASELRLNQTRILDANEQDLVLGQQMVAHSELTASAFKRLVLNKDKIEQMALNMESVANLPDPVGKIQKGVLLDEGLELYQVTTPIGVLMVIFESRPEVVVQISALTIKSGNAVILKGGKEANHSNQVLVEIINSVLARFEYFPANAVNLIQTREEVAQIVQMSEFIDLIIPRGSNSLVRHIQQNSRVPVLAHADGICHVFLDKDADAEKSREIVIDAKLQYPAVCNAMETLLVHREFDSGLLAEILQKLQESGVELRVCDSTRECLVSYPLSLQEAIEADWATEYTDLILSVKMVDSLGAAIEHINRYGSKHTDAIVTENQNSAEQFMNEVDASSVFWNASTRFADGFRYGFGAEVGISTSKTHARGPVGLDGLVIYKYKLYGQGQGVARYSSKGKTFLHRPMNSFEIEQRFPSIKGKD
ncbi:glutamate-5-semialdehyde dehydrogenase [Deltaproteobacteria bacterium TL4]